MDVSPDGKTILWGNKNGIHVTDASTYAEIATIPAATSWLRHISDRLAISHDSREVTLWHLPTFTRIRGLSLESIRNAALAPDGKHVAVSDGSTVSIYRIGS